MEKTFTLEIKINGKPIAEVDATAHMSYCRMTDSISIDKIELDVIGTRSREKVVAFGEMFAQLAAQIDKDSKRDLEEILEEMRAGVVAYDREMVA